MKVYTQLDGYPGTIGYVIYQDDKGFIWIGTDNGATCFDGKKFKVIDDRDGLKDKEIIVAVPYSNGYVLLSPLLNNFSYYTNGKIVDSSYRMFAEKIHNRRINNNKLDNETRNVWLGDADNNRQFLHRLSGTSIEKVTLPTDKTFSLINVVNDRVYLSLSRNESKINMMWFDFGIFDYKTGKLTELKYLNKTRPYYNSYSVVSYDGKYIASYSIQQQKLLIYNVLGDTAIAMIKSYTPKKNLKTIVIDQNNHLWITFTGEGVEYLGKLDGDLKPFTCLENMVVNNVFVDRDNNIWFTTEQKGLCFISAKHWQNALLNFKFSVPSYLPWSIAGDGKENIYIGHFGNSLFTTLNLPGETSVTQKMNNHMNLGIKRMLVNNKTLYMGNNMDIYASPINNKGQKLPLPYYTTGGAIKDITSYSTDSVLSATHTSVELIVKGVKKSDKRDGQVIFYGRATTVLTMPDKSILVGTPSGLYMKNSLFDTAHLCSHTILSIANITDMEYAINGYALIGTSAQGIYCYNYLTKKIAPVKTLKGNRIGTIRHVHKQNDSIYWLSTDGGVIKTILDIDMKETSFTKYTFLEGLPSNNAWGVFVQNDTAYVTTASGLGILPITQKTSEFSTPPQVWITEVRFDDSVIYFPHKLALVHNQNDLQFSLSAISYESIGNTRYRYKLYGLSDKWVETESPEISFSGLSPGEYMLEAYAINFKGMSSNQPVRINISIRPAFWQTAWFKWIVGILIAGGIYSIIHWWVLREKNKQYRDMQQKKRLAELELEAIKAQMNPHFVYNCLNSIQYFSYKNDYEPVKKYLDLFAKLIRQTMQYSQETFITLEEEINYLTNYLNLEKIRFKEKLNFELIVDEDIYRSQQLPAMMIQPYVENALKHGIAKIPTGGLIRVHFGKTSDGRMRVTIEDNGPGLKEPVASSDRKHLGLRLSGSRASTYNKLFNLDIQVNIKSRKTENPDTQGTIVELLIPQIVYENRKV